MMYLVEELMRGKVHPTRHKYWKYQWHRYFVWWPKKIHFGPSIPTPNYDKPWRWVWLEIIERRENPSEGWSQVKGLVHDPSVEDWCWIYRFPSDEVTPNSSEEDQKGEKET